MLRRRNLVRVWYGEETGLDGTEVIPGSISGSRNCLERCKKYWTGEVEELGTGSTEGQKVIWGGPRSVYVTVRQGLRRHIRGMSGGVGD